MSLLNRRMSQEIVVFVGTDIPPMSNHEFSVWGGMEEAIQLKNSNILSMDEIFEGRTFEKKERFELMSQLIKKKIIKRIKIDHVFSEYVSIPKMSYRQSSEMRVYYKLSKKDRATILNSHK